MKKLVSATSLVLLAVLALSATAAESKSLSTSSAERAAAKEPVSKDRLKGMKDAVADLEKGLLQQKDYNDRPDSPEWANYVALLTKECGVKWVTVLRDKVSVEEMEGYNDVMRAEIEHRFGRDIFDKLWKKAEEKRP
jgi:hypothetical protein